MENFLSAIKIQKRFKGGSLSSTSLVHHKNLGDCILKTASTEKNREYGFVRFSSQIKRHNLLRAHSPLLFPKILDLGIDKESNQAYCFYEYKKGYINFVEFLLSNPSEKNIYKSIKNLIKAFEILHENRFEEEIPNGSLDYYVKEEMLRPLKEFSKFFDKTDFKFNDLDIGNTNQLEELIMETYKKIKHKSEKICLIHGNSTLENILINKDDFKIAFIDPYDETYFDNYLSDYSQVLQCSKYFYGLRMLEKNEKMIKNNFKFPNINESFIIFNKLFEIELNKMNIDKELLNLLVASQFTRLLPFRIKANDIINAKYFYSLSFWLLSN